MNDRNLNILRRLTYFLMRTKEWVFENDLELMFGAVDEKSFKFCARESIIISRQTEDGPILLLFSFFVDEPLDAEGFIGESHEYLAQAFNYIATEQQRYHSQVPINSRSENFNGVFFLDSPGSEIFASLAGLDSFKVDTLDDVKHFVSHKFDQAIAESKNSPNDANIEAADSPLKWIGYRVGRSGINHSGSRQNKLRSFFLEGVIDLGKYPEWSDWGKPGSRERKFKMLNYLSGLASLAERRKGSSMSHAIRHWNEDYKYCLTLEIQPDPSNNWIEDVYDENDDDDIPF